MKRVIFWVADHPFAAFAIIALLWPALVAILIQVRT